MGRFVEPWRRILPLRGDDKPSLCLSMTRRTVEFLAMQRRILADLDDDEPG